VRLLIVEAPGVLYPIDNNPPNADPITSGLRLVRALTEGFGVSVLLVAQIPSQDHELQLKAWADTYDVSNTWRITEDETQDHLQFWETTVMTYIGRLRATPVLALTAHTPVAHMLATRSVPTSRFYAPDGNAPDWGPATPAWANSAHLFEE